MVDQFFGAPGGDILSMGIAQLSAAYDAGELLPSEVCRAFMEHQARIDTALNVVVERRHEEAMAEAQRCDAQLRSGGARSPLFGIPFSMKESFNVQGMATTGGMTTSPGAPRDEDAPVVRRLREAGAIITCKTGTPELCFCQESDSLRFGRLNNPWDPDRTTGGSSGGEGALLAVGGTACGFGSDIGGSIRVPSHFNGVVGFKPASFAFPMGGHLPDDSGTRNVMDAMLGYGPIAKSVEDAALVYSLLAPSPAHSPYGGEGPVRVVSGTFDAYPLDDITSALLAEAQKVLVLEGCEVDMGGIPMLESAPDMWQIVISKLGVETIKNLAYPGTPSGAVVDYLRYKMGLKPIHHQYLSWGIIGAELFYPSNARWEKTLLELAREKARLEALLAGGVFLTPVYPHPAGLHGTVYHEVFSIKKTFRRFLPFITLGNLYGMAAMSIPCGLSPEGLPVGLQIAALGGSEARLFAVARILEAYFGGYRRNTSYD